MGLTKQVKRHSSKGCKQFLDTHDRIEKTQVGRAKRFHRNQIKKGA